MPPRGAATRRAVGAQVVGEILARSEVMKPPSVLTSVPGCWCRSGVCLSRAGPHLPLSKDATPGRECVGCFQGRRCYAQLRNERWDPGWAAQEDLPTNHKAERTGIRRMTHHFEHPVGDKGCPGTTASSSRKNRPTVRMDRARSAIPSP